ncbi:MAG: LuxR family transcriptional regulator [Pseudonocardia sp.]|jgi:DNA-binding NarL/FixJ family response regulator|uniref:response regulator n=1 Tax=Pseudonocardia sp. TaxID=60912 RepID=UPI002623861F|nr:response regulator transcription factor [Pseudonocardia sp.]MCU1626208.1 LuxR family transcriptional regulator [Pseudonocardia sp.]MDT7701153.1 two-component system, NarL family, nitrate/nitrite response regulator NarL [Pseudonocardiales bacterium]
MGPSIVIVDDHPAIVDGVRAWCAAAEPPIRVLAAGASPGVALAGTGAEADVVVFDLQLDGAPAFRALTTLADAGRRVVVYSQHADSDTALRCLELGAATYLTKAEGPEHLIPAVQAVVDDLPYTPPVLGGAMAADRHPDRPVLSEREREVLLAWFESDSKQLVAQRFHLSAKTVDTYINRVRIKYADVGRPATTKAALVARALQDGLIDLAGL